MNTVNAGDLVRGDRVVFSRAVWTIENTTRALTDRGEYAYAVGQDDRGVKFALARRARDPIRVEVTE